MNYGDWVNTFKNRTPEQLRELINAINVLEKDVDINREFDDVGLFAGSSGCSIRGAAKEALNKVSADQRIQGSVKWSAPNLRGRCRWQTGS